MSMLVFVCVCVHVQMCMQARECASVAQLCLQRHVKQQRRPRFAINLRAESVWKQRLGSQRDLEIQEWSMWVCVQPVSGLTWCLTYEKKKSAAALRKNREVVKCEEEKTDKQKDDWQERSEDKVEQSGGINQRKWTKQQKEVAKKRKQTQIGCERLSKTRPILSSLVCFLEKIKLSFFFLEHGETKSIALPVHSYYFSKSPARREKEGGRRRMEGEVVSSPVLQKTPGKTRAGLVR